VSLVPPESGGASMPLATSPSPARHAATRPVPLSEAALAIARGEGYEREDRRAVSRCGQTPTVAQLDHFRGILAAAELANRGVKRMAMTMAGILKRRDLSCQNSGFS
jgi:hypothetical protein